MAKYRLSLQQPVTGSPDSETSLTVILTQFQAQVFDSGTRPISHKANDDLQYHRLASRPQLPEPSCPPTTTSRALQCAPTLPNSPSLTRLSEQSTSSQKAERTLPERIITTCTSHEPTYICNKQMHPHYSALHDRAESQPPKLSPLYSYYNRETDPQQSVISETHLYVSTRSQRLGVVVLFFPISFSPL